MASSITVEAFEQQAVAIIINGLKECTDTFCATLEQRAAETKRANDMLFASFHVPTTRQEKIAAFPGLIHLIDQAEEADRIRCIISHAKIRAKRKEVADRLRALPVPDCMKEHRAKTWFRMAKRRMTLPRTRKRYFHRKSQSTAWTRMTWALVTSAPRLLLAECQAPKGYGSFLLAHVGLGSLRGPRDDDHSQVELCYEE